jgi:hypothetical protein
MPDPKLSRSTHALYRIPLALLSLLLSLPTAAGIIPDSEAWERWRPAADTATVSVDHSPWGVLLATYLVTDHPSGINRFDYASVSHADRQRLVDYLGSMARLTVSELTPAQQQAYWVNLYNALTVQLILDHPEVSSIRQIKDGFFSIGPWGRDIIEVGGEVLTLDDIEHRILRPLFQDPRVHFAVNCASLGCPNLQAEPFTAENLDTLYESAARAFINHPRGANIDGEQLTLSSIFKWFKDDFGDSRSERLAWLAAYAKPELAEQLRGWDGRVRYAYDWDLNAP